MINDIERHETDNLGGIFKFKFIPVESVQSIPSIINGVIHTEVKLYNTTRWYDGYATFESMSFTDEQQYSEHGAYHKKVFKGVIPRHRADVHDTLNSMKNRKFILIVWDNNEQIRLVGNLSEPLKFTSGADTKSNVAGRNEYAFEFSGEGLDKSPFYNVDCPLY